MSPLDLHHQQLERHWAQEQRQLERRWQVLMEAAAAHALRERLRQRARALV
jgi:hypothetical protein